MIKKKQQKKPANKQTKKIKNGMKGRKKIRKTWI